LKGNNSNHLVPACGVSTLLEDFKTLGAIEYHDIMPHDSFVWAMGPQCFVTLLLVN